MSTWAVGSNQHKKIPGKAAPPVAAPPVTSASADIDPLAPVSARTSRLTARSHLEGAVAGLSGHKPHPDSVLADLYAADDADEALALAAGHYPTPGVAVAQEQSGPPHTRAAGHLGAALACLRGRKGLDGKGKATAIATARSEIAAARDALAPLVGG